jgi:release factor glutamine methyltransferase
VTKNVYLIIKEITHHLEPHYQSSAHAQTVAWWLLERLTQKNKLELVTQIVVNLEAKSIIQLNTWISQHINDKYPLHYILGSLPFGPLEIKVEPPTLIPRPETEEWVESLITTLEPVKKEKLVLLDMCTGSGCIGLSLAYAFPNATVYAIDISDSALSLAQKNAAHNNIKNIIFLKSDLFHALQKSIQFDLIVSNPPYIAPEDWHTLSKTIQKWEDRGALIAQNKGLKIISQLITQAPKFINQKSIVRTHGFPKLVLEIGHNQGLAVQKYMEEEGFDRPQILKDFAGIDRVVIGW